MQVIKYPNRIDWKKILQRPGVDNSSLIGQVKAIINNIKLSGDVAARKYTEKFDGIQLEELRVADKEFQRADELINDELKNAIQQAAENIERFHEKQFGHEEIVE